MKRTIKNTVKSDKEWADNLVAAFCHASEEVFDQEFEKSPFNRYAGGHGSVVWECGQGPDAIRGLATVGDEVIAMDFWTE